MKIKKLIPFVAFTLALAGCNLAPATPEAPTYKSISVYQNPTKIDYTVGECFEPAGLKLTAVMSNDLNVTVEYDTNKDKFTFSPSLETPLALTDTSVTVTFERLTTTVAITVSEAGPVVPDISIEEFNTHVKNPIVNNHNYSAHIKTMLEGDAEPFVEYNFVNINDDAIYDDKDTWFFSGFIKQKNQGIVDFQMLKTGQVVIPNEFYATKTDLGMSSFYEAAPGNAFTVAYSKDATKKNEFVSTNTYAMAVIANLGLGLYSQLAMNPTNFKVVVNEDYSQVDIVAVYVVSYVDPDEASMDDSFRQVNATVTISLTDIGSTTNAPIEAYLEDPSTVFYPMTSWEDGEVDDFIKGYYDNQLPPFVTGLSYATEIREEKYNGIAGVSLCDYASGDLSSSYGEILGRNDYEKINNYEYLKEVEDTANNVKKQYRVVMTYRGPNEAMQDGTKYGFYYPNGFFKVQFVYSTKSLTEVKTGADLKAFFAGKDISKLIDLSSLPDTATITGFKDNTDESNKGTTESVFKFVAPSRASSGFYISIPDYNDAKAFIDAQRAIFDQFLEDGEQGLQFQKSAGLASCSYSTDDSNTQIRFTYLDEMSPSSYNGKVQIGYIVSNAFFDAHFGEEPEAKTLDSITVSGYKTEFYVGDIFSFDGTVRAHYTDGSSRIVRPTSVSNPNLTTAGEKEVTVTYEEGDVTKTASYTINVSERPADEYQIKVAEVTGATVNVTMPTSKMAKENESVTFKVDVQSGYTLTDVKVTWSGGEVEVSGPNPMTKVYGFQMPAGDVTITPVVDSSSVASHSITYSVVDSEGTALVFSDVIASTSNLPASAKEGATVAISVAAKDGYEIKGIKVGTGAKVESSSTSFVMGTADVNVVIYADVKQGGDDKDFGGTYKYVIPMSNPAYYNEYALTFNDDLTGSYVRTTCNASGTNVTGSLTFTYTIDADNNITVTLVEYGRKDTGTTYGPSDFASGYRLFPDTDYTINPYGKYHPEDGTVSYKLTKSDGTFSGEYTFTK